MLEQAGRDRRPHRGRVHVLRAQARAGVGVQSLLDYQGRWIAETRDGLHPLWAEVARAGQEPVPLLEGDLRLRRAQPALAGDDPRRTAAGHRLEWHELVRFAEDEASSEIWPDAQAPDEKWVTERAYENPKFVEDLVRDVALRLNCRCGGIGRYSVDVENFESIHNHSPRPGRLAQRLPFGHAAAGQRADVEVAEGLRADRAGTVVALHGRVARAEAGGVEQAARDQEVAPQHVAVAVAAACGRGRTAPARAGRWPSCGLRRCQALGRVKVWMPCVDSVRPMPESPWPDHGRRGLTRSQQFQYTLPAFTRASSARAAASSRV
jgi:hypothetical protein